MPSSDWSHFFDTVPSRWREPLAALLQRSGLKEGTLLLVTDEDRPELSEKGAQKLKGAK